MSDNVLDKLVVKVHLDAREYRQGERDVTQAFDKTKESAKKTGETVERAGKTSAESIKGLTREVMTLFSVFTAGRGVKEFVQDVTKADNALGKLSYTLKTAPETISAWGQAIERIGGSGQAAAQSFKSFSNSIQELKTTGNTGMLPWLYKLQAAGGQTINLGKGLNEIFIDLSKNLSAIAQRDPAMANFLGERLGLDHDTIQMMMKGPAAVREALAATAKTAVTEADTKRAADLVRSFTTLFQTSEKLGRTILNELSPDIVKVTEDMNQWADANEKWMKTGVVGAVRDLVRYLKEASQWLDAINKIAQWAGKKSGDATGASGIWPWIKRHLPESMGGDPPALRQDNRSPWERWAPKILGGKDAPPQGAQVPDAAARGNPAQSRGGGSSSAMPNYRRLSADQKSEMAAAINKVAADIGADPKDVAAVMSFETGGTMNPHKIGGAGNRYRGLIQWSPENRKKYFGSDENFYRASITEQVEAAGRYWKDRGYRRGMPMEALYSAVLAGRADPRYWDRTDANGTSPRSGVRDMRRSAHFNALAALERSGSGAARPEAALPNAWGAPFAASSKMNPISRSNTNTTQIGTIQINTMATDASGIARDMGDALAENSYATMANTGAD